MIPIRDYLKESEVIHGRILFLFGFVTILALILIVRLAYLQISQHERFSTLAQNNRIDFFPLPPTRGLIYDRNGEVLAQNFTSYNLEILPDEVENWDRLLDKLRQLVELTDEHVSEFKNRISKRPKFERMILRTNLREDEAARFAVNQHHYPAVKLRAGLQRHYPRGELTSHVIGYIGRISGDDLNRVDNQIYRGLDYIGRSGIESYYESDLLGKSGIERVETNAHGRVLRSLEQVAPDSGHSIHLGLDIKLQQKSIELLEGYEGAIVAIEPATGDVLAFASVPTFDANPFVNGISQKQYAALSNSPRRPLFNRALYGRYAPGSTIKSFMSLIGMGSGISHDTEVVCIGWYSPPGVKHRYRDWKKSGHGKVDGHDAIVQSCDVYFYRLAMAMGIDRMHEGMGQFGFGEQTGIDLPDEPSGLMPSRDWKKRARGAPWYQGETVITGIGQGYMLVTPLQLASATATLANRGKRIYPRFLTAFENAQSQAIEKLEPRSVTTSPPYTADQYARVINSMKDVVHGQRGTARSINRGIRYEMAGKTGTAQVKSIAQDETYDEKNVKKEHRDHSLFVGFAPLDDPKIAIAVIIEHGGSGSRVAAPIARGLLDYYLLERLKLYPEETLVSQL